MPEQIAEAAQIAPAPIGNRWRARIIEGDIWGSSGYYPADVLERDGATTWPQGTAVFFDHPGETERYDRPERSVRDLAGRIASTPAYEGDGLYADIEFYSHAAPIVKEMAGDIGLSIRAAATIENGEAAGKSGPIIKALHEGLSVDLVTKAGAGGKLVSLMESARPLLVIDETPARPQAPATDPTNLPNIRIWSESGPEAYIPLTPEQRARGTKIAAAEGDTTDVPAPAGQSNASESKENAMATTQIEEAELGRLREDSQRVQTAESDKEKAITERDESRAQLAEAHRQIDRAAARDIVRTAAREADVHVDDYQVAGIAADYPTGENGRIDADKLAESAKTAIAKLAEEAGAGQVRGFGATTGGDTISESDARAVLYGEQKGA